jgi:phage terminase large subunit-like protein
MSTVDVTETTEEQLLRIERVRNDYAYFVEYYFPHYCTDEDTGEFIPCAKFHIAAAKKILREKNLSAVFKWARGHAKSTHMDVMIPMWLKCQKIKELNVMVVVGKSEDNAIKLLGDLQAELQFNKRYAHDFGEQYNSGSWEEGNFVTKDGCAFFALGRGQSPRGLKYRSKRPNYIVIDDLDDDELCENPKRVRKLTHWVREALYGTMGGKGGRFIMVGNLINKCSVLANMIKIKSFHVSEVNIINNQGEVSWPEYWTQQRIDKIREDMGYVGFERECMNNPINEGTIFRHDWIKYKKLCRLQDYDMIVAYCDPSWKNNEKSDFKAVKVWGRPRKGLKNYSHTELHQLFAFVRRCSVSEMVRWMYDLNERLPDGVYCNYYMEANFMQDLILDEFTTEGNLRGYQLPIIPDKEVKGDKYARIESISPLWERGFVFYNIDLKDDPDTVTGLEQTLAFEKGASAHDDSPDADAGAIKKLQKSIREESFLFSYGERPKPKNIW